MQWLWRKGLMAHIIIRIRKRIWTTEQLKLITRYIDSIIETSFFFKLKYLHMIHLKIKQKIQNYKIYIFTTCINLWPQILDPSVAPYSFKLSFLYSGFLLPKDLPDSKRLRMRMYLNTYENVFRKRFHWIVWITLKLWREFWKVRVPRKCQLLRKSLMLASCPSGRCLPLMGMATYFS